MSISLADILAAFSSSLFGSRKQIFHTFFPLLTRQERNIPENSKVLACLAVLPSTVMALTVLIGGTSKGANLVPSSEPLSVNSLTTMGSLETSFEAGGTLEEVSALGRTNILEATERESPNLALMLEKVWE